MIQTLEKYEYDSLWETIKYYCDLEFIKNIGFHQDFIFTIALNRYLKYYGEKRSELNEKQRRGLIKAISRSCVNNYKKNKSGFYNNEVVLINENDTKNVNLFQSYINKEIKHKLDIIYDSLSEREHILFEFLEKGAEMSKSKACKMLNITEKEYESFIIKMREICERVGIKDNNN